MGQAIGLYGGSFNPIHFGHLISARAVAESRGLDRVIFLPGRTPPHKQCELMLDAEHRAEMVRLAIAGEPAFEFSDHDLRLDGPCYTIDTIEHFRNCLDKEAQLCWIIGADSLSELPTWHRATELIEQCEILTAFRPGWDQPDWERLERAFSSDLMKRLRSGVVSTPRIAISSTDIRTRIACGRSIRYLAPESVHDYIECNHLYQQES
ncbi:MAG: nicotinate (nicotinamide) nucleotide adenylyltransferase [Planctomycetes bacterium]|nr:nicotinate (nicotinamide) nucleotide adenylyltransferase [Planctomycetota bacterium]MBI3832982.1 nicotinate (nicotinamide) nucleotide adenylyltransferase [Planctomycetota bacterium]